MKITQIVGLLLTLVGVSIAPRAAQSSESGMTFRLVPEDRFESARETTRDFLETGQVFLYRENEYEPRIIAPLNQPISLPPGQWLWTAEAPGFVTVNPGQLNIPEGPVSKTLVWPAVPACQLTLGSPLQWPGIERVDIVSLVHGNVFPIHPKRRRQLWIPAGSFLAYTIYQGQLFAIGPTRTCQPDDVAALTPPEPPHDSGQQALIRFQIPERIDGNVVSSEPASVVLHEPRKIGASISPSALVWQGPIASAFFVDVPTVDLELQVHHPRLRTVHRHVPSLEGGVHEIVLGTGRPRTRLTVPIDYIPKRPHQLQEIFLLYCGFDRPRNGAPELCEEVARAPLRPGLHEVSFDGLDTGYYRAHARIDDEVVYDLASGYEIFIQPDDGTEKLAPPQLLREMEIFGNILVNGERVEGEVQLQPRDRQLETRRFPTDDELLYHIYFFGRLPSRFDLNQLSDLKDRDPESLLGLHYFSGYQISACTSDSGCRTLNLHSKLIGEGRFDIEMGMGPVIEVEVRHATTSAPLEDAQVVTSGGKAVIFLDGKKALREPPGVEGVSVFTDARGKARIQLLEAERQSLGVVKEGFEIHRQVLEVASAQTLPDGSLFIQVPLEPLDAEGGIELLLDDGTPLAGASVVHLGPAGQRDPRCSKLTDNAGRTRFGAGCLDAGHIVVFHRDAQLRVLEARELTRTPQVNVPRSPSYPIRVRVTDEAGQPIAGAQVFLRFGEVELGPNDLLRAANAHGGLPFYLTDRDGTVELRGIDPTAADAPEVKVALGKQSAQSSLLGLSSGEILELTLR